ncbi:MAG: hypothetical protein ACI9YH_000393 [Colwellia sp.]|jgi:hypothetical protein
MKTIESCGRTIFFLIKITFLPFLVSCDSESKPQDVVESNIPDSIVIIESTKPSGNLAFYDVKQEISITTKYKSKCSFQDVTLVYNNEIYPFSEDLEITHKVDVIVYPEKEYIYKVICRSDVNDVSHEESKNLSFRTAASTSDTPAIIKAYIPTTGRRNLLVLGYNLGESNTYTPLIHDDFENGIDSQVLLGGWTLYRTNNKGPFYTTEERYSGNLSVKNKISYGSGTEFNTAWKEFVPSEEVYLSYRFMFKFKEDNTKGVMKLARLTSDYAGEHTHTPHYNGPGDTTTQYQPSSKESGWLYNSYNIGGNVLQETISSKNFLHNQWNRIEIYKKLSNRYSVDGSYMIRINNTVLLDKDNILTRASGFDFKQSAVLLPLMFANPNKGAEISMYVDDVYLSSNRSRIELANCPNYDQCSIREIQKIISWQDNEVEIELRIEQLSKYVDVYLFLIDSDGVVSEGQFIER